MSRYKTFKIFAILLSFLFIHFNSFAINKNHQYDAQTKVMPDAQTGGWFINLGITGARGKLLSSAPKEVEVAYVFKGTPAFGKLKKGDKIIGVNGKLFEKGHKFGGRTDKKQFGYEGPLMDIGNALEDSQGPKLKGRLSFKVKRAGKTIDVLLIISTKYGQFGKTFPFSDKKSDLIFDECIEYILKNKGDKGNFTRLHFNAFAALALLSTKKPKHIAAARDIAKWFAEVTESKVPTGGLSNWRYSIGGIVLAEFYLATREKWVLPELTQIRDALLESQLMKAVQAMHGEIRVNCGPGGWGHNRKFEGYGPFNMMTGQAMAALGLIEQCSIKIPHDHIISAHKFISRGTNNWGYVWYNDKSHNHTYQAGMGSTGIAAIAHYVNLSGAKNFKQKAVLYAKAIGQDNRTFPDTHGDTLLGIGWTAVGAIFDPESHRKLMDNHKWYFNLAHNPDGTFHNQPHRQKNAQNHKASPRMTATCAMALIFAVKYKSLLIMGAKSKKQVEHEAMVKQLAKAQLQIDKFLEEKEYYKAYQLMNKAINKYGQSAVKAKASRDKLLGDEKLKKEVTADMYYHRAASYRKNNDIANFKKTLKTLMSKYPDSLAAAKAKENWYKKK